MSVFDAVKDHPVGPVAGAIGGFFLGGPLGALIGIVAGSVISAAQEHFAAVAAAAATPDAYDQVLTNPDGSAPTNAIQAAVDSGDPNALGQSLGGSSDDGSGGAMSDADDTTDPDADNYDGGGGGGSGGGGSGSGSGSASGGGSASGPSTTPSQAPPAPPGTPKIHLPHGVALAHSTAPTPGPSKPASYAIKPNVAQAMATMKKATPAAPTHTLAQVMAHQAAPKKPAPKPVPHKPSSANASASIRFKLGK